MSVIVIVIAGTAANFGRIVSNERHNGMIGEATALYAVVVDHVT